VEELGYQLLDRMEKSSHAGRYSVKCLGKQAFCCHLKNRMLQLSSPQWGIWYSWSLMEEWRALQLSDIVGWAVPLSTLEGKPPGSCSIADCHSVEELEFQLLDREEWTLL
jgi:hypothetical protein